MSPSSPNAHISSMIVRDARASSVVVQRVPLGCTNDFLDWERGVSQAAEGFPGYRGTDLYPPAEDGPADWLAIVHFEDAEQLRRWIESPARAEWLAKLPNGLRDFQLKMLSTGFDAWFTGQETHHDGRPPGWKMALTVLLGLYPTVMLLAILAGPYLSPLGMAGSMLVSNALSISILQWVIMPSLQRILSPWLTAGAETNRSRSMAWLILIALVLTALVVLFRLISG